MLPMGRRILLLVACLGAGCARPEPVFEPPPNIAGWTLAEAAGGVIRYRGTPDIQVHLERKRSQTLAFSAVQDWRAREGQLAFFHGRYFGIAESPGASQRTLNTFVAAFDKMLPE